MEFLDASGLNQYHTTVKAIIDSSIVALQNSDIGLAGAVETLAKDAELPALAYDKLNILIDNSALLKLTVSPTTIFVGDSSTLNVTSTTKNNATSIIIKNGSGSTIASGSGTSLVGSTTVTPGSEGILGFTATAVVNGTTLSAKTYVNCVAKIYYGSGNSYTDATNVASVRLNPKGKYTINVANGKYIFLVVPSSMAVTNVLMNGVTIPMNVTSVAKGGISYKSYQSKNQYISGTYEIVVN